MVSSEQYAKNVGRLKKMVSYKKTKKQRRVEKKNLISAYQKAVKNDHE